MIGSNGQMEIPARTPIVRNINTDGATLLILGIVVDESLAQAKN